MKRVAYLVRHGKHQNNILTPEGIAQVSAAAEAIKTDTVARGEKRAVYVFSSEEPRAVQSAAIMAAVLGIKVKGSPHDCMNPAAGLGKAITDKMLPGVGDGFAKVWRDHGCEGTEEFTAVARRAVDDLTQLLGLCPGIPVVATHGGVIEPLVNKMIGADCHDMAEGEVAVVEIADDVEMLTTVRFLNRPGA